MSSAVSAREAEVLDLLGRHLTHAEIAAHLVVSIRTVESHVASLRRKLDIPGHRELVRYAAARRGQQAAPAELSSFVGRVRERAELAHAVSERRLVSVVGTGGAGKTRLARVVAADVAPQFPDGVWFADLVPVQDDAALPAAVAAACGSADVPGRDIGEALVRGIGAGRALLVLDNCEHVVNAVAVLVERLVTNCPSLHVIVTSRARLVLPFERVYQLGGLSLDGEASALLIERAVAAGWDQPAGDQLTRMDAICAAVDGLALAIELAAVRLPALGLDGVEAGLTDQGTLLAGGERLSPRHRSMQDTLDWSCRLLGPLERTVLSRASVFAAPFDATAARHVVGFGAVDPDQVPSALARLADQSLLTAVTHDRDRRWRLLEPIRQYGQTQLSEADVPSYLAHFNWARHRLDRVLAASAAPGRDWFDDLDEIVDDVRAALGWVANQPARTDDAAELAHDLGIVLFRSGRTREALHRYEQAADLAGDPARVVSWLGEAAAVAKCLVLGEEAVRLEQAAVAAARDLNDPAALAGALAAVAETVVRFSGMFGDDVPSPAPYLDELGRLSLPDSLEYAAALVVTADYDDVDGPRAAEAVAAMAHRDGDRIRESAALDVLTAAHVMAGRPVEAAECARRRVDLLGDRPVGPAVALELKDALRMAALSCTGAGDLGAASHYARRHRSLAFLREQRDLALEETLAPDALAGRWDAVLADAESFMTDWVASGRPMGPGRAIGPCAVAMVHGLRGDDDEMRRWFAVVARLRGTEPDEAGRPTGYGATFDAIVQLDRDRPDRAYTALGHDLSRDWYGQLFCQWRAALLAEAAVLSGRPDARSLCAAAATAARGNAVAAALAERAGALLTAQPDVLGRVAADFDALDVPYQARRTVALAQQPQV